MIILDYIDRYPLAEEFVYMFGVIRRSPTCERRWISLFNNIDLDLCGLHIFTPCRRRPWLNVLPRNCKLKCSQCLLVFVLVLKVSEVKDHRKVTESNVALNISINSTKFWYIMSNQCRHGQLNRRLIQLANLIAYFISYSNI